jgi:isopenicillin-N epimerase
MNRLGWEKVRHHNHGLAVWAHQMLAERWKVAPLSPVEGQLFGATATLPLPAPLANMSDEQGKFIQQSLYDREKIEVPFIRWQEVWHIRVSCQVYNRPVDYQRLAEAIERRARE